MAHPEITKHLQEIIHAKFPDLKDWEFARAVINAEQDNGSPEYLEAGKRWAAEMEKQHTESVAAAERKKEEESKTTAKERQ